jgi:hypothetical protein
MSARQFEKVVVDMRKLSDYCLSPTHPRGKHKARVFRSRLGLTTHDAEVLRDALVEAVQTKSENLRPTAADAYGQRYSLDFAFTFARRSATVRSFWIVLAGERVLRLLSCYLR